MCTPLVSIDFRFDCIGPNVFNTSFGAGDGSLYGSPDGAVLSSWRFTQTARPHLIDSWLDSFKLFSFLTTPIVVCNNACTKFEADIATRQVFACDKPIPECLYKRVRDIYEDLRLASSGLAIIDPDTGIWYAILGTDHQLWAVYGRLPIYRVNWPSPLRSVFAGLGVQPFGCNSCVPNPWVPVLPRCSPWYDVNKCEVECRRQLEQCKKKNRFDQTTFSQDENYLMWLKCLNPRRINSWKQYNMWKDYAAANKVTVYDWQEFVDWSAKNKLTEASVTAADADAIRKASSWVQYQNWVVFNCWKRLKKEYLKMQTNPCDPAPLPDCPTDNGETSVLPCDPKIYYEFCAEACMTCCEYAAFLHAVPLIRRESCNPQCDFDRVGIWFDAHYNTVTFVVNGVALYTVVKPGHRLQDEYKILDYGGYAETIVSSRFIVGFGNFTFLDAALPNNYARQKYQCDYRQTTALAQLLPDDFYYQTAFNKHGELEAVIPTEAFGITNCKPEDRLFGQGSVLIIRNLIVCQSPLPNCESLYRPLTLLCCPDECPVEESTCPSGDHSEPCPDESSSCGNTWVNVNFDDKSGTPRGKKTWKQVQASDFIADLSSPSIKAAKKIEEIVSEASSYVCVSFDDKHKPVVHSSSGSHASHSGSHSSHSGSHASHSGSHASGKSVTPKSVSSHSIVSPKKSHDSSSLVGTPDS